MTYNRPTHRNPEAFEQTEVCMMCGSRIGVSRLTICQVYPLVGLRICDLHKVEGLVRSNPSYTDYQSFNPPLEYGEAGIRQEPYGMEPWWEDPLNDALPDAYE